MRPPIPVEEVARLPAPGTAVPTALTFSPDDRFLTFLHSPDGSLHRHLQALDTGTGQRVAAVVPPGLGVTEESLSLEERLLRERRREVGQGVSRYAWARRAPRLLVPLPDGVHVLDGVGGALRRVVDAGDGPVLAPTLSPDGSLVAFVRDGEVHVVPATGGPARPLTSGAVAAGRTHGLAEFVAQEEMDRDSGYWWSADGDWLAFTEVDESSVPVFPIVHQSADPLGGATVEEHRYPFAGGPNAVVALAVVPVAGGEPQWLDLGGDGECYLARVDWMPDGTVVAQVENRAQTGLDLFRFDPDSGRRSHLLREESDVWINLHDLFHPLERLPGLDGGFVWASERTGFRHLYLCDGAGSVVRPLTTGEWMVDSLDGVDEDTGTAFFTATRDGPTERHLYAVPLAGGEPRRLTSGAGTHHTVVDHRGRRFVDVHSALDRPPTVTLRTVEDGRALQVLHDTVDPRVERLGLVPPELVTLPAGDGTPLHAALHRPEGEGPFPTVVSVYGGPHAQRVVDGWSTTVDMRAQLLRSLGFLVVVVDNRGSARRGLAFEAFLRHRLGTVEVDDQVGAVAAVVEQGLADPGRVAVYGWSYGGYLSALCLARAPEVFRAAVAGAPVTHWEGYDTHYTERYMGTPAENPEGYAQASVLSHAGAMAGRLLLIHGLLDENVHFRHTARLVTALVEADRPHELLLFPDERHLPRRPEDRRYMEERVVEFLRPLL